MGGPEPVGNSEKAGFYVREMRRGLDHPLVALELEESFELGRRLGIRIEHPFFDPDLIGFLYRIPPERLVGDGGPDRHLARDLVAKAFPDLGFSTLKKSDARGLFRGLAMTEGLEIWRRLGGPRELAKLGIVEPSGVEREVDCMIHGSNSAAIFRLWDLINAEVWLRGRAT